MLIIYAKCCFKNALGFDGEVIKWFLVFGDDSFLIKSSGIEC